jgi:hypothetical protein
LIVTITRIRLIFQLALFELLQQLGLLIINLVTVMAEFARFYGMRLREEISVFVESLKINHECTYASLIIWFPFLLSLHLESHLQQNRIAFVSREILAVVGEQFR